MILDDQFSKLLRLGEITPAQGLDMLKANEVRVWGNSHAPEGASWEEVSDAAASGSDIQHTLAAIGAGALAEEFSTEVQRLRDEGFTVEALFAPSSDTA